MQSPQPWSSPPSPVLRSRTASPWWRRPPGRNLRRLGASWDQDGLGATNLSEDGDERANDPIGGLHAERDKSRPKPVYCRPASIGIEGAGGIGSSAQKSRGKKRVHKGRNSP